MTLLPKRTSSCEALREAFEGSGSACELNVDGNLLSDVHALPRLPALSVLRLNNNELDDLHLEELQKSLSNFDVVAFGIFHAGYGPADNFTPFKEIFTKGGFGGGTLD
mgnify:CR=1 FL=1